LLVAIGIRYPATAPVSSRCNSSAFSGGATRNTAAPSAQAVATAGALWVAVSTMTSETLLRLNPGTLRLTRRWRVAAPSGQRLGEQVLAVAGGGLWVDGANRLLRLSLPAADCRAH